VLPYFRRNESFMGGGEDAYRGREGRLTTDLVRYPSPAADAFVEAALQTGANRNADYNGRSQAGVAYAQATVYRGRRCSAAHAYLHPARQRHGVQVLTDALVTRVVVEQGRAAGVDYLVGGQGEPRRVRARVSTIVSAGTINTARLLQVSGLGPAPLLQSFGIPVIADLPGVGQNLMDHYAARVTVQVRPGVDTVNSRGRGLRLAREVLAYALGGRSILAMSVVLAYAFYKLEAASAANDYLVTFVPVSFKEGHSRKLYTVAGVSLGSWGLRPESRGEVRIRSADIREAPFVNPNHLGTERDRRVNVAALKRIATLLGAPALQRIVERPLFPRQLFQTDDEWLDFLRRIGLTTYHVVGTAKMGPDSDPLAVVDRRLRVRGVPGLRVVDASVMPRLIGGNTNAPTIMIAERAADLILSAAGAYPRPATTTQAA